jgi:hypothetical protein
MAARIDEEKKKLDQLNLEIANELRMLSRRLKEKAADFEKQGKFDRATTCYFLAGYLKGAAEFWTKE